MTSPRYIEGRFGQVDVPAARTRSVGALECELNMALVENQVLTRELGRIQCRVSRFAQEQAERIRVLEAEMVRLRGRWIQSLTENAYLREQQQADARPAAGGKARSGGLRLQKTL